MHFDERDEKRPDITDARSRRQDRISPTAAPTPSTTRCSKNLQLRIGFKENMPMTNPSPPPVPQRLREMLKDYPVHIERLQEALNTVVEKPFKATLPFEVAIWALESRLGAFVIEARKELKDAEASGNEDAISEADAKERLMSRASWKHVWLTDEALWEYFQKNKDASDEQ